MRNKPTKFQIWQKTQRKYRKVQKELLLSRSGGGSKESDNSTIRFTRKLEILKKRLLELNRKWRLGIATSVLMGWMAVMPQIAPAQDSFPLSFELSGLDGTNGFRIQGVTASDFLGSSVSGAGDLNGDGIDDIVIGARAADPFGLSAAGITYVILGKEDGFAATISANQADIRINGIAAGDQSGGSVNNLGDVNGDGLDDIVIGSRYANPNGEDSAGQSYVIFGSNEAFSSSVNLSSLNGSNGFILNGVSESDRSGFPAAGGGDFNGDGINDILIGSGGSDPGDLVNAGRVYVVYGQDDPFPSSLELSELEISSGLIINGAFTGGNLTFPDGLSIVGDINNDGFDDIGIGATSRSTAYVVFGTNTRSSVEFDLSSLDGTNGFELDGVSRFGSSIRNAGDINGDDIDDLIVGASDSREAFVVFGQDGGSFPALLQISDLNGTNGFKLTGTQTSNIRGYNVSTAGDINGDGISDILVASGGADTDNVENSGKAYVIFGRLDWEENFDLSDLNGTNGFFMSGMYSNDNLGGAISHAGDVNNDGLDDIIVATNIADPNGVSNAGEAYVVFGRSSVNRPPFVEDELPDLEVFEGFLTREIDLTGIFSDPDLDELTFNANSSNEAVVTVSIAEKTLILDEVGPGLATVTVVADDGNDSIQESFEFEVIDLLFTPTLTLSDANITFDEEESDDGFSVDAAHGLGDVNGDGLDDIAISDDSGSGTVYVINGSESMALTFFVDVDLDGSNGQEINGLAYSSFGSDITSLDFNNDGYQDLIISADGEDPQGLANAGAVYILFGDELGRYATNIADLSAEEGFKIEGVFQNQRLGSQIAGIRDFNGDDVNDIALLGSDRIYVIFGSNSISDINLLSLSEGQGVEFINDEFMSSLAALEDYNGDNVSDLIFAKSRTNAFVIYGNSSFSTTPSFVLENLSNEIGFEITGSEFTPNNLGNGVSSAGDFNNDGFEDIVISGRFGSNSALTYILFGKGSTAEGALNLDELDQAERIRFDQGVFAANSLGRIGDINDDGIQDLGISGYFLFGTEDPVFELASTELNGVNGFRSSITANALAQIGDFNGDDVADLLFENQIFFGRSDEPRAPVIGDASFTILENSANGASVGFISASDANQDQLTYTILSGNTGNAFSLDSETGELMVSNSSALDFESNPLFSLEVQASDGSLTDTGFIVINLRDINEEIEGNVFSEVSTNISTSGYSADVLVGDVDGDGFEDLMVINYSGTNRVFVNDGDGNFSLGDVLPYGAGNYLSEGYSGVLEDLDGDGDLDLLEIVDNPATFLVFTNDGSGEFTLQETTETGPGDEVFNIAAGDIDGDDDVDIVFGGSDTENNLVALINDGNAGFSQEVIGATYAGVALGDIDGDDDLDIFSASGEAVKVLINDGQGNFSLSSEIFDNSSPIIVSLDDLDDDGDLDGISAGDRGFKIFFNDGFGSFSTATQDLSFVEFSLFFDVFDVDSDGDVDIVNSSYERNANQILFNDGDGNFSETEERLGSTNSYSAGVTHLDIDGDGDNDAIFANFSRRLEIWENLTDPDLSNNPPVVENSINDQVLIEGFESTTINLEEVFVDADEDALMYTVVSSEQEVVTVTESAGTLTITEVGLGASTISVTADDGKGGTVTDEFETTVEAAPNNPPVIEQAFSDTSIEEGIGLEGIELNNRFSDPDGDVLTFTAVSSDASIVSVSLSGSTFGYAGVSIGTATVSITADDGNGGMVTDEFEVAVEAEALALVEEDLLIYPNPTQGQISIRYRATLNLLSITDVSGRKVKYNLIEQDQDRLVIDLSTEKEGIYFFNFEIDQRKYSIKISKTN